MRNKLKILKIERQIIIPIILGVFLIDLLIALSESYFEYQSERKTMIKEIKEITSLVAKGALRHYYNYDYVELEHFRDTLFLKKAIKSLMFFNEIKTPLLKEIKKGDDSKLLFVEEELRSGNQLYGYVKIGFLILLKAKLLINQFFIIC